MPPKPTMAILVRALGFFYSLDRKSPERPDMRRRETNRGSARCGGRCAADKLTASLCLAFHLHGKSPFLCCGDGNFVFWL